MNYSDIIDNTEDILEYIRLPFAEMLHKTPGVIEPIPPTTIPLYRNPKECPQCHKGRIRKIWLRNSRTYFYGCSRYPACRYTRRAI